MADPSPASPQDAEALLESSWSRRGEPLPGRERRLELLLTAALVLACSVLVADVAQDRPLGLTIVPVLLAYAASVRVVFPVGAGFTVPSQLFLVPLFAVAPAPAVPLLVLAGLSLARLVDIVLGRARLDRLVLGGGNAVHALGPALVLVAASRHGGGAATWPVLVAGFVAQLLFDLGSGTAREWLASGVRPQLQLRVQAQVWAVDAALTPVGLLAAVAAARMPVAPLALCPLVALLAHMARDRERRITRAHERLEALERERHRLRVAVRRIGDAFASNLDLDALLQIVTRAATEALDADAGRACVVRGTRLLARAHVADDAGILASVLDAAQRSAIDETSAVALGREDAWALAAPIGAGPAPTGAVGVARRGAPFSGQERDLFAYLCEQAGVSAANVDRHATLHRQAITDELTGLSNHRRLQEVLGGAVDAYERTQAPAALVLLDLDDFKLVNDAHGHQTGDMVLRAVAGCLRAHCRKADEPARYGGEELALVLADTDAAEAAQLAERVRAAVASLALCDPAGRPLPVTVSVGVASLGDTAVTKAALIAAADAALYGAKAAGKNRVHTASPQATDVSAPGGRAAAHGSELTAQLRRAVAREELELHYQPKVTLADGRVIGVEALLRWHHPERGTLRPSAFLDVPGAAAAAPEVTRWTLSRALEQAVAWRRAGRHLPVAVNISAHDLADRELPQAIARLLADHGAEPGDLRLEITEHGVIADAARAEAALAAIRRLGVGISLDDFGTGHSSLTRLRDLPVDELKLDRGFLRATAADADVAVIRAAVSLGRDLNLTVVAEGIEDLRQWHLLRAMGCDVAQGYFVAPGLRPHELERWLAEWRPQVVG